MTPAGLDAVVAVAAAALGGAAIGVERQWSGHATGPGAHFAGVRTFTLLGGVAGMGGWLWRAGAPALATVVVGAAAALVVAAYVGTTRRDVEATTEVAALVVLAAGVLDGLGELRLASGVVALTWMILLEKSRLHALVARIADVELRAGARFAVMAVVVLPLLPEGPYGPLGGVRPRELWAVVLLFSGISFVGYLARRAAGAERGHAVTGLVGGLVSSTGVTLTFARASRRTSALAPSLALGTVAASTVMFARLLAAAAMLEPSLALAAVPALAVPLVVGVPIVVWGARGGRAGRGADRPANPLELATALQMAAVFQGAAFLIEGLRRAWGDRGLLASSALVGLTDTDALLLALVQSVRMGVSTLLAARALALGAVANTAFKLGAALLLGAPGFRGRTAAGLGALGAAGLLGLVLVR